MASISIRTAIAWADAPREEPTSTLVLTSPGRRFVDIRILWDAAGAGPTPPAARLAATAHFAGLDWAFAGTSTMTPLPDDDEATAGAWNHWIDSRAGAAAAVDAGLCYPLPDGTMREVGTMAHPATGVPTAYEELWQDEAPAALSSSAAASSPAALSSSATASSPRCVVLQLGADNAAAADDNPAGLVVRLGRFCQGVVRTGADRFAAERWQWAGAAAGWQRVFRHGTGDLPIGALFAADAGPGLRAGAHVTDAEGHAWAVVEAEALDSIDTQQ